MVENKIIQHKISKNFTVEEMACKCGNCDFSDPEIDIGRLLAPIFVQKLQSMRSDLDKPFKVLSAARCEDHNLVVGGAKDSAHIVSQEKPSCAADICLVGWTSNERYMVLRAAIRFNMWGIGIYKNFIHVDSRKSRKSSWWGNY